MSFELLCRIGVHGQVGRFRCQPDLRQSHCQRGSLVLCRTNRGIESAEVLTEIASRAEVDSDLATSEWDGVVLRGLSTEDQLLNAQLRDLANEAFTECQQWLQTQGRTEVLLEVEPLMDGQTLYFHFLGEPASELLDPLQTLGEIYQTKVQESRFANLLEHGCGPGCGTEERSNCGPAGSPCSICVVAHACKKD